MGFFTTVFTLNYFRHASVVRLQICYCVMINIDTLTFSVGVFLQCEVLEWLLPPFPCGPFLELKQVFRGRAVYHFEFISNYLIVNGDLLTLIRFGGSVQSIQCYRKVIYFLDVYNMLHYQEILYMEHWDKPGWGFPENKMHIIKRCRLI